MTDGLPSSASGRMTRIRSSGTWGSAPTSDEFAAIRGTGFEPLGGLEFTALGTAVRAPDAAHGQRTPFTSDVSGQDFAKLIMAGWVPAGLALGVSIRSRHDDRTTTRQARRVSGNAEVSAWTARTGTAWTEKEAW